MEINGEETTLLNSAQVDVTVDSQDQRIAKLLEEASGLEIACSFEETISKVEEVLKLDPENALALIIAARSNVSLGTPGHEEKAKAMYHKSILLYPNEDYEKYFAYASLLRGEEAVHTYQEGIKLLIIAMEEAGRELSTVESRMKTPEHQVGTRKLLKESSGKITDLRRTLNAAHVAISEIYLTDLKDQPGSIIKAKTFAQLSINAEDNPEGYLILATIHCLMAKDKSVTVNSKQLARICVKTASMMLLKKAKSENLDYELTVYDKCIDAAMRVKSFYLSKALLEHVKKALGDLPHILTMYAIHHRKKGEYHLKGSHYYAGTSLQIIDGRIKASEAEPDDLIFQEVCLDIKENTPTGLTPLHTSKESEDSNDSEAGDSSSFTESETEEEEQEEDDGFDHPGGPELVVISDDDDEDDDIEDDDDDEDDEDF